MHLSIQVTNPSNPDSNMSYFDVMIWSSDDTVNNHNLTVLFSRFSSTNLMHTFFIL